MAFQSIPQSSFASGFGGGLGAGAGQGLAESVPKEVERVRLSQGLKNLGQDFSNLTPIEQISKLVSIPGMNAQTAMAFIPYLKEQQSRKALEQRAGQDKGNVSQIGEGKGKTELPSQMLESPRATIRLGPEELLQEANKLASLYPGLNDEQLKAKAKEFDEERVGKAKEQAALADKGESEFNRLTDLFLHKKENEKFADIIGEMQGEELRKIRRRVLDENISPFTAAEEASKDMLNFAKSRQQLRTNKAALIFGGKSGEKVLKDLQNARPEYAKRGQLENFRNDLITYHKLTPENAARIAYPESEDIKPVINSLPRTHREKTGSSSVPSIGLGPKQKLTDTQIENIAKKMSKQDSPKTIALSLLKKGYDGGDFIERLKNYADDNDFSDRQKRDLTSLEDRYSLGDIQLFGLKGLPEVGAKR